jgi:hypothetical protein
MGNFVFASLVSLIGNRRVTDVASGMRVFRRDVLDRLYPLPNGLNFTPVMSVRAIHENIRLVEVPIPHGERDGHSKLSVIQDGMRFFNSIVWTALAYNPARILGLIGLSGVVLAAMMFVVLLVMRLSGITELGRWGIFGVYAAMAAAVTGVSLFNLGAMFNYLITLFQKRPIRQGLLGRPMFKQPLERQFWWMGSVSILIGVLLAFGSLALSYNGWVMDGLWLYFLGSAAFILIGVQFVISWIVMRVLEELSKREADVASDLRGSEIK